MLEVNSEWSVKKFCIYTQMRSYLTYFEISQNLHGFHDFFAHSALTKHLKIRKSDTDFDSSKLSP